MAGVLRHCLCGHRRVTQTSFPIVTTLTRNFYDKEKGVDREVIRMLQQDIDLTPTSLKRFWNKKRQLEKQDDQKFRPERLKFLGPDLAAAHFIVARHGAVKFLGREKWFRRDKSGAYYIPNRRVDGLQVEAIDASGTELMYVGLDNLVDLECLRYLSVSNCQLIDDWCLSRLHMFSETLEFLDVSGCPQVTERGLACLHHLRKLKGLNIANLPKIANKELVTLYLEEMLPDCTVIGVRESQMISVLDDGQNVSDRDINISDGMPEMIDDCSTVQSLEKTGKSSGRMG
ncbi:hypothetical protein ScPMuIL_013856 [Solemya velum]